MNDFNKVISFVLGIIVVVVFLAIITGRLNLGKSIKTLSSAKASPTPKVTVTPTPATKKVTFTYPTGTQKPKTQQNTGTQQTNGSAGYRSTTAPKPVAQVQTQPLTTIPSTGAPTLLLPFALSGLAGGTFLRKSGKKKS